MNAEKVRSQRDPANTQTTNYGVWFKTRFQICQLIAGSYVKPNEIINSDHFVLAYTD